MGSPDTSDPNVGGAIAGGLMVAGGLGGLSRPGGAFQRAYRGTQGYRLAPTSEPGTEMRPTGVPRPTAEPGTTFSRGARAGRDVVEYRPSTRPGYTEGIRRRLGGRQYESFRRVQTPQFEPDEPVEEPAPQIRQPPTLEEPVEEPTAIEPSYTDAIRRRLGLRTSMGEYRVVAQADDELGTEMNDLNDLMDEARTDTAQITTDTQAQASASAEENTANDLTSADADETTARNTANEEANREANRQLVEEGDEGATGAEEETRVGEEEGDEGDEGGEGGEGGDEGDLGDLGDLGEEGGELAGAGEMEELAGETELASGGPENLIGDAISAGFAIAGGVMAILSLFHHTSPPPQYNNISGTFLIKGKQQTTFINNLTKTRDKYAKGSAQYNSVQDMINNVNNRIKNNIPIVNFKGSDGKNQVVFPLSKNALATAIKTYQQNPNAYKGISATKLQIMGLNPKMSLGKADAVMTPSGFYIPKTEQGGKVWTSGAGGGNWQTYYTSNGRKGTFTSNDDITNNATPAEEYTAIANNNYVTRATSIINSETNPKVKAYLTYKLNLFKYNNGLISAKPKVVAKPPGLTDAQAQFSAVTNKLKLAQSALQSVQTSIKQQSALINSRYALMAKTISPYSDLVEQGGITKAPPPGTPQLSKLNMPNLATLTSGSVAQPQTPAQVSTPPVGPQLIKKPVAPQVLKAGG
jgi:hypothetical protein